MYPLGTYLGFPSGLDAGESVCHARDLDSFPGLGRCPEVGNRNLLQYSNLENFMDIEARSSIVHG